MNKRYLLQLYSGIKKKSWARTLVLGLISECLQTSLPLEVPTLVLVVIADEEGVKMTKWASILRRLGGDGKVVWCS